MTALCACRCWLCRRNQPDVHGKYKTEAKIECQSLSQYCACNERTKVVKSVALRKDARVGRRKMVQFRENTVSMVKRLGEQGALASLSGNRVPGFDSIRPILGASIRLLRHEYSYSTCRSTL